MGHMKKVDSALLPFVKEAYEIACHVADRSNCKKNHSGAVVFELSDKGTSHLNILGLGYNLATLPNLCCLRKDIHSGLNVELCSAIHAEQYAVMCALRNKDFSFDILERIKNPTYLVYAKLKPIDGVFGRVTLSEDRVSCTLCSRLLEYHYINFVYATDGGFEMMLPREFNKRSMETVIRRIKEERDGNRK
jgi:hypothetical protein